MTPRVVYDTMIHLQAATRPQGPAFACVSLARGGAVGLCVSDEALDEARDVLSRPKIRRKYPQLTDATVRTYLDSVERCATRIDPVPAVVTLTRDPNDEKHLNLAVAAGAAYLVSRDNDLLDLMTGTDPDAVAFRAAHPGILVLDPVAFLRTISPAPPAAPTP
ncbi:MAG: putative toxin-antitoxin system toxin component, PIN family [Gemmataceae bacterium]|nr:putative toxin-antitoxin system toxin component, PIN family [Gemmataceae bacterium]